MHNLTEGLNNDTEMKVERLFPLEDLLTLLDLTKNYWFLRKDIFLLLMHVYLDRENEEEYSKETKG